MPYETRTFHAAGSVTALAVNIAEYQIIMLGFGLGLHGYIAIRPNTHAGSAERGSITSAEGA